MDVVRAVLLMAVGLFVALAAERIDGLNRAIYRDAPRWVRAVR